MFGQFETDWPRLRQKLIDSGTLHGDERDLVSLFIGLQASRTSESFERREFVASVAAFSDERPLSRETVRRYLAELHLGFPPEDGEVAGAWTLANFVLGNGPMPSRDDSVKMATEFAVKELRRGYLPGPGQSKPVGSPSSSQATVQSCCGDRRVTVTRLRVSVGTLPTKCASR